MVAGPPPFYQGLSNMSDNMIAKVEGLLHSVSDDVNRIYQESIDNNETFLGALDDVAANVLALQALIAAMLKKYPIDAADAKAWLQANMDSEGQGAEKAEAVVDFLIGEK